MEEVKKKLLTVNEVADLLGLGRSLVYTLVSNKEIASFKVGRARRIPIEAVDAYIAHQVQVQTAK